MYGVFPPSLYAMARVPKNKTQQGIAGRQANHPHCLRTACEYCCRAKTLVRKDGERACSCAHSYAMKGLAKYLILNHDDTYSEDKILGEINRWKALFFPKQSIQKVIATSKGTGAFNLSVLQEMPNMVGGCELVR